MTHPFLWRVLSRGRTCRTPFLPGLAARSVFAAVMISSICFSVCVVCAADNTVSEVDYPLAVINAASMQRLRDNAGTMFESAERKDMTDRVDQWMTNSLKDAKGLDRQRPFGMMLYLSSELLGPPLGIMYLPVTNLQEALDTLSNGAGTIDSVEGKPNRYEIQYDGNFKVRLLYRHGYLFLVFPDGNDSSLDREFPDPEKLTARISSQHDIAISLLIKSIPVGLKSVLMAYFKTQSQADLQQRDDEPESVYRLRRANGEVWVELIDKVVNQGHEITLGLRVDNEQKVARVDLELAGTRDSKFAKFFQGMAGKKTYFGNLLANPATFTLSLSVMLEEKQRQLVATYFEAAQRDLAAKFDQDDVADLQKIVTPIFKTFTTSAEAGHLDAFAQLAGTEQEEFALVAGVKLTTSRELPARIEQLLDFLKEGADDNDLARKLELSVDSIDSHPVHRLPIAPDKGGQRLFGPAASLYVYASPQTIWCAVGGDEALTTLKSAVQTAAAPQDPQLGRNRVPVQLVTHAKNWISVADDENPGTMVLLDQAESSFGSDNDAMTVELRPTDTGVRIRAEFQTGFIALLGRSITRGIETGSFNRRPRRRDGAPQAEKKSTSPDVDPDDLEN